MARQLGLNVNDGTFNRNKSYNVVAKSVAVDVLAIQVYDENGDEITEKVALKTYACDVNGAFSIHTTEMAAATGSLTVRTAKSYWDVLTDATGTFASTAALTSAEYVGVIAPNGALTIVKVA